MVTIEGGHDKRRVRGSIVTVGREVREGARERRYLREIGYSNRNKVKRVENKEEEEKHTRS